MLDGKSTNLPFPQTKVSNAKQQFASNKPHYCHLINLATLKKIKTKTPQQPFLIKFFIFEAF